jgi:hypothetical protein
MAELADARAELADARAATGTYLLRGMIRSLALIHITMPEFEYISVDVKTLRPERVCSTFGDVYSTKWIYTNFPASLSSPKI